MPRSASPMDVSQDRRSSRGGSRSPSPERGRSPRRSTSPRSKSRSRSPSRSRSERDRSRRDESRRRSVSRSRSRSPGRGPARYRTRSYSRSPERRSESPPRSTKIVVEKLTKNVNENHLKEIFGSYGPIREMDMPINKSFMTNRGTAYISYNNTVDAEAAISHMHEAQLDGAVIKVSIVLPRRRFSPSPPPAKRPPHPNDRYDARGPPGGGARGPPSGPAAGRGMRGPSPRRDRYGGGYDRPGARNRDFDTYRPRSFSRSRSPVSQRRSRSRSYSSRSRSPRRRGPRSRYDSPPRDSRRRRSPSYSSYSSDSRSRSRDRRRDRR